VTVRLQATAQIVRNYQELFVNRRASPCSLLVRIPRPGGTTTFGQAKKEPMCLSC